MTKYKNDNDVFNDYLAILQENSDNEKIFRETYFKDWNNNFYCFSGFYKELEKYIDITDWGYIPNKSGGFMGCNFCWYMWKYNIEMCLQFENSQLCIKIGKLTDDKSEIRTKAYNDILSKTKGTSYYGKITKPTTFGSGKYITIAIINEDLWFERGKNGYIDIFGTVQKINKMMDFVASVCNP